MQSPTHPRALSHLEDGKGEKVSNRGKKRGREREEVKAGNSKERQREDGSRKGDRDKGGWLVLASHMTESTVSFLGGTVL